MKKKKNMKHLFVSYEIAKELNEKDKIIKSYFGK